MGVSLEAIFDNTQWGIAMHSQALAGLQEKAATGQEINRISDDPNRANNIIGFLSDQRSKEVYIDNLTEVTSILELSDSVVQSIVAELGRARKSVTSTLNGFGNAEMRQTLADDLNKALETLVSFANTQRLGQQLFAGARTDQDAYIVERNAQGEISLVAYQGSLQEQPVEVAEGLTISPVLVGDRLFRNDTRETPIFFGDTGVAAGTGTSSVRGDVILTVTGSAGNYQLSIDGGLTSVTVDGSETNVAIVHSETGQVLYVDATNIQQTGTDMIRVPGTYDIFNSLIHARDLLNNEQNLDESRIQELLNSTITSMDGVEQKLVNSFPVIGGRIQILTGLKGSLEDIQMNTESEISRIRDADVTQVAIDLARHQLLYEMSLTAASKLFSMSLLDFLR